MTPIFTPGSFLWITRAMPVMPLVAKCWGIRIPLMAIAQRMHPLMIKNEDWLWISASRHGLSV
jgi:hypothetical protein